MAPTPGPHTPNRSQHAGKAGALLGQRFDAGTTRRPGTAVIPAAHRRLDEARVTTYCHDVVILHRLVIVALFVALLVLSPVAHASPPDQSWIAGFYDNADFDDVVLLITGVLGAVQPSTVSSLLPLAVAVGIVTPMDSESGQSSQQSCDPSRAPPLA